MKQFFLNNRILKSVIILNVFLFLNVSSFSQKSNNDNQLVATIDMNKHENIESEQSIRQIKSEKITKRIQLNVKEKELLLEIKQLTFEAKQCIKDADLISKDIIEINKTAVKSDEIGTNKLKTEKKIRKQKNLEISLRYDAEELYDIGNSLLYEIYVEHFPKKEILESKKHKYQKQILAFGQEADELFKEAKVNLDKASFDFNFEVGIDYLRKANLLKREAIKKYEQGYSLFYNMPIKKSEYADLSEKIALINPNERTLKSDTVKTKTINTNTLSNIVVTACDLKEEIEIIIYKVQIGAFTKTIDVSEFHGLSPLSEDKRDQQEFSKYMVGEYFSYKAASEAKRIIVTSTKYQDAFVVAYKKDKRVALK
jgi:hypothetical protein